MERSVREPSRSAAEILLISHAFPPDVGGAQNVAVQNARVLSQSYNVEVLTGTEASKSWDKRYDFEVTRLNIPFGMWPLQYARAFYRRRNSSYKAVIFNDPASIYSAGLFAPPALLKRGIAYLHGSEPELFFSNPKLVYRIARFRHYFERGLEGCRLIASVSNYMARKFIARTGLNQLRSKMKVAYAGVDRRVFYPDPFDVRGRHDIPEHREILLSASRIVKEKGYDDKLAILKNLLRAGHSFHWIIAGDGPYRDSLLNQIDEAGLADYITWVGALDQEKLRRYYSSVDVFWLLSRFEEAFGLVYIEANACGTPVIGRRKGGVEEAIENQENGFLVGATTDVMDILIRKRYKYVEKKDVINFVNKFDLEDNNMGVKEIVDCI